MADPDADWQRRLRLVKAHAKDELGGIDGVKGFGISDMRLRIYVRDVTVERRLPDTSDGVPVECIEVGDIEARPG